MKFKKILSIAMLLFSIAFISCGDGDEVAQKANDEVLNDSETLSTNLVNNPSSATEADMENAARLVFTDTVHDFGNLTDGEVVEYEFEYKNAGKKEIIITNAKGSCGCTVPEYDTKPIAPGATGSMKVTFDSKGKIGYNEKKVDITTNGFPQKYMLVILATVN